MSADLEQVAHRPWPLPAGVWIMEQNWHDLLFAHWPVGVATLRPHIPARLAIDTFDGQAWLGVVPFRMSGVRLRGTPAIPLLSAFPELNVRTYVVADGKPGVWFFSLDAGNAIAVEIARAWFHLPYFRARMSCEERKGWIEYTSERTHRGAPRGALQGRYLPVGEQFLAQSGSIEHFLMERYCLYTADGEERMIRGNSPRAVAAASCRSRADKKYDGRGRRIFLTRGAAPSSFCETAGRRGVAASTPVAVSCLGRDYHLWKTKNTASAMQPKPAA